jgi:hypothetical protein
MTRGLHPPVARSFRQGRAARRSRGRVQRHPQKRIERLQNGPPVSNVALSDDGTAPGRLRSQSDVQYGPSMPLDRCASRRQCNQGKRPLLLNQSNEHRVSLAADGIQVRVMWSRQRRPPDAGALPRRGVPSSHTLASKRVCPRVCPNGSETSHTPPNTDQVPNKKRA